MRTRTKENFLGGPHIEGGINQWGIEGAGRRRNLVTSRESRDGKKKKRGRSLRASLVTTRPEEPMGEALLSVSRSPFRTVLFMGVFPFPFYFLAGFDTSLWILGGLTNPFPTCGGVRQYKKKGRSDQGRKGRGCSGIYSAFVIWHRCSFLYVSEDNTTFSFLFFPQFRVVRGTRVE